MPTVDGVYYPTQIADGQVEADVPAEMLKLAQSLRGRTVRAYPSSSERDSALAALPSALRRGAMVFDGQWRGYTGVGESASQYTASALWSFDRAKGSRIDYTSAQGNGNYGVPGSLCFFDGQPPSSIIGFSMITDPSYYVAVGNPAADGSQCFFRVFNRVTGAQVTGAAAISWIAVR